MAAMPVQPYLTSAAATRASSAASVPGASRDWLQLVAAGITAAAGLYSQKRSEKFAERMSSTAHQREVLDLQRAGLNPLLSLNQGASSPTASMQNPLAGLGELVVSGKKVRLQEELQRASIGLMDAQGLAARGAAAASVGQAAKSAKEVEVLSEEALIRAQRLKFETAKATAAEMIGTGLNAIKDFAGKGTWSDTLIKLWNMFSPSSSAAGAARLGGEVRSLMSEGKRVFGPGDTIPPGVKVRHEERDGVHYYVEE